jgi:hypothetical protein
MVIPWYILVYLNDLASYKLHVQSIFQTLEDTGLQLDIKKYKFDQTEVKYLGIIILTENIRINPDKINTN